MFKGHYPQGLLTLLLMQEKNRVKRYPFVRLPECRSGSPCIPEAVGIPVQRVLREIALHGNGFQLDERQDDEKGNWRKGEGRSLQSKRGHL
jgi:hypothetical protein